MLVIDDTLVARLIAAQFPQWAPLPIRPVADGGWDNRTFRLGEAMTVRLPSAERYAAQVEKEQYWLPRLAPHLPLSIPVPLAMGEPGEGFPFRWSVYAWREGEAALPHRIRDLTEFAVDLGRFLLALNSVDPTGGPPAGPHNFFRGGALAVYDAETRRALDRLDGRVDAAAAKEIWVAALSTEWERPPVWFHGDVAYGNLLVEEGRLSAVIDFGTSGIGDPACDLVIAWTMFEGRSRAAYREVLSLDAGTWARGRGWALWKALIVAAGMVGGKPGDIEKSWSIIDEVIEDHRRYA